MATYYHNGGTSTSYNSNDASSRYYYKVDYVKFLDNWQEAMEEDDRKKEWLPEELFEI